MAVTRFLFNGNTLNVEALPGTIEREMSVAGGGTTSSITLAPGASDYMVFTSSAADTPGALVWSTTDYAYSFNVTTAGNNISNDLHLYRWALTGVAKAEEYAGATSGTGVKTASGLTLTQANIAGTAASDRFGFAIGLTNSSAMSSQTYTITHGSNSWAEGDLGTASSVSRPAPKPRVVGIVPAADRAANW